MNNFDPLLSFDSSRLSHAYIASGDSAEVLAMAAVCSGSGKRPCMSCAHCDKFSRGIHPDVTIISKLNDRNDIIIDQIRGLKRDVIVVPNEADRKVYIINNAELMNINAQNAFLQILEEPPSHAVFILKTDSPDELLPTVRSRCVELKARVALFSADTPASEAADSFFAALSGGNIALASIMFDLEKLDKEQFAQFLTAARERIALGLRDDAHGDTTPGDNAVKRNVFSRAELALTRANEYLDMNVNIGHITGMICASLMRPADRKGLAPTPKKLVKTL